MVSKCLLETEGYQILLELRSLETSKKDVDMIVEFTLNPHLGSISVQSIPGLIALKDLQRLITYFEEHIDRLKQDPDSESYTFVTYGLGFQVQALSGEVRSPDDGEFTVRFMVNVGQGKFEASRTYVGGESEVTLKNIKRFISSLQLVLVKFGFSEVIL